MIAMDHDRDDELSGGVIVLEHLTGPSRGTVTWLGGTSLNVSLRQDRFLDVSHAGTSEPHEALIARLRRIGDSYEIVASDENPIWVNGARTTSQVLKQQDVIEFGEAGPICRYRIFQGREPARKLVTNLLRDGVVYLRVSRRPIGDRLVRATLEFFRGLALETTVLFRVGTVIAMAVIIALIYQQYCLSALLEQRIEAGASRIESFSGALTRTRHEAITPADLRALRTEVGSRLSSAADRLAVLEQRSAATARVIAASVPSIAFLQGAYGFQEVSTGRMLRHVLDDEGRPLISPVGQPLLALEGEGPVASRQFTGTGFAVGDGRVLVTSRHLAQPWEDDANVPAMASMGLVPVLTKFIAYAPRRDEPDTLELLRTSDNADLALLRRKDATESMGGLSLAVEPPAPGAEVIVMGYPTGLKSLLAQAGDAFIEALQTAGGINFWGVAERLAKSGHIVPLASRGIVSQTTSATIVYDAETTVGGSGGPVLDVDGNVVAVNTAILPEFGGSNLGVPAAKVRSLLEKADLN